jgi:DNA-directed RNA polymerase subunit RPC12/RpoP
MPAIKFFNSVEHLEPKCSKCESKIEYDVTTHWDDEKEGQVCNTCGQLIE